MREEGTVTMVIPDPMLQSAVGQGVWAKCTEGPGVDLLVLGL